MIDLDTDYIKFLEQNKTDDLFLHVIVEDEKKHTVISSPSILFIQNVRTEQLYHFGIHHTDVESTIPISRILENLRQFTGKFFVIDKKSFIQHFDLKKVIDIELGLHLIGIPSININSCETPAHVFIKQKNNEYSNINRIIPLMKHREYVNNIFLLIKKYVTLNIFSESYFEKINSEIIEPLSELESNGIYVNIDVYKKYYQSKITNGFVYSQYNLHTSTGRPSNRFGGVNYAAIKKDDGSRSSFVSRFGEHGTMVMIDYSAFHPHIIGELINFKIPVDIDFYKYMAKLFFKKSIVDQYDVDTAKTLTFKQLYGGIEDIYKHIQYFHKLSGFIQTSWDDFNKHGFILTPTFGRKILKSQIVDVNPNKLFNYLLQATETEIVVPVLGKVNCYLTQKKSNAVLYTYDSILFDIHLDEFDDIVKNIVDIMKLNNRFPVKCYVGLSYDSLKLVDV